MKLHPIDLKVLEDVIYVIEADICTDPECCNDRLRADSIYWAYNARVAHLNAEADAGQFIPEVLE